MGDSGALIQPEENVCLKTSRSAPGQDIFPFQFVFESAPGKLTFPRKHYHYCLYLVTEGAGTLETETKTAEVGPGDLIFTFAGQKYSFLNICKLKYMYISFVGAEIAAMLAGYGVTEHGGVYPGYEMLIDRWISAIGLCTDDNLPTLTKGLLYFSLALLPADRDDAPKKQNDVVAKTIALMEKSCGSSTLSLSYVCSLYNYHPSYLSRRFRTVTGRSFSEYLRDLRLRKAEKMLTEDDMTVTAIAAAAGYSSYMYFARVFRKAVGCTPTEFRKRHLT